jgi:hypothetical protein
MAQPNENAGARGTKMIVVCAHCGARYAPPQRSLLEKVANPPYDLIVSHFVLDCLTTEEVQSLTSKMACAVSPGSLWIVSEFAVPPNWFGWLVARPAVWALYRAFGWLTRLQVRGLPVHSIALRQAGFILQKRKRWLGGLLISELWSSAPAGPGLRDSASH